MKLFSNSFSLLKSRPSFFYQRIQTHFFCVASITRLPVNALYSRISPLGDPNISLVPVLDQWVGQGNHTVTDNLRKLINWLTMRRRFKQALEVSLWMTNKKGHRISPFDLGVRLKLIYRTLGLEQAENHFNKIPEKMRTFNVYLALLNCYTMAKSLDKAESTMQKARDLGYVAKPVWYNLMMNLHSQLGNVEKISDLLSEMDSDGIRPDQFTFSMCLRGCEMKSDTVGIDKIVKILESDPTLHVSWRTFIIAAEGYIRLGSVDKALVILNNLEDKVNNFDNKDILYAFLIKLYAEAGKKGAVYRIWNLQRTHRGKFSNKSYMSMLRGLHTIGDIKGMENITEEWDSSGLSIDFRVPNLLVNVYCLEGRLEEAKTLINREISRGGNPMAVTWCHLAGGYLGKKRVAEAVEALKKAILLCPTSNFTTRDSLKTCLECLERGDNEKADEILKLVRVRGDWREANSDVTGDLIDMGSQSSAENQDSPSLSMLFGMN